MGESRTERVPPSAVYARRRASGDPILPLTLPRVRVEAHGVSCCSSSSSPAPRLRRLLAARHRCSLLLSVFLCRLRAVAAIAAPDAVAVAAIAAEDLLAVPPLAAVACGSVHEETEQKS